MLNKVLMKGKAVRRILKALKVCRSKFHHYDHKIWLMGVPEGCEWWVVQRSNAETKHRRLLRILRVDTLLSSTYSQGEGSGD